MTVNGLPAHVLLVHAVVVLVPLSALLVVLVAIWPVAGRRLTLLTMIVAVASLIAVPITSQAGEWLEHRMPGSPLMRIHTELGDYMLPWSIALAVIAVALFARDRFSSGRAHRGDRATHARAFGADEPTPRFGGKPASIVLAVLAVVIAVGSVTTVYRIGDSGARAAWTGQFSQAELPRARPAGSTGMNWGRNLHTHPILV